MKTQNVSVSIPALSDAVADATGGAKEKSPNAEPSLTLRAGRTVVKVGIAHLQKLIDDANAHVVATTATTATSGKVNSKGRAEQFDYTRAAANTAEREKRALARAVSAVISAL